MWPAPAIITQKSPNQYRKPNHGLTAREWRLLCAAFAAANWRFNRNILEKAGIPEPTTYGQDGRTGYGALRDELIRAGLLIDNHIHPHMQHHFTAPTPGI